jgi:hypothetical protein
MSKQLHKRASLKRNIGRNILFSSLKEQLLLFPYERNFFDCYKPLEHCILDNMNQLEYKKCNCNKYWIFNIKDNTNKFCGNNSLCFVKNILNFIA